MSDPALSSPPAGRGHGHPDSDVAEVVYRAGLELEVSGKVMLAAFESALVESGMQNLDYGDRDSLGVFQQRPSQGWGTAAECMNVHHAARQFFTRAAAIDRDYPAVGAGELAQSVQRSAYPKRYDEREDEADRLLAEARHDVETTPPHDPAPNPAQVSEWRFNKTLRYIHDEMVRNQNDKVTWAIQVLYHFPDTTPLGLWNEAAHLAAKLFRGADWLKWQELMSDGLARTPALTLFAVKVAPRRDWDHKPRIQRMFHLEDQDEFWFKIPGDRHDPPRELYYDVWSNVHYGYVGRAAGIERGTLIKGPNIPGAGKNDPGDDLSTEYGMDLWDRYEDELDVRQFRAKIYQMIGDLDQRGLGRVRQWPGR